MPTIKESQVQVSSLHELFEYDKERGVLVWKERPEHHFPKGGMKNTNARLRGTNAGTILPNGYVQVRVFNTYMLAHRVIWAVVHGAWPEGHVDHINHIRDDNQIDNLRIVGSSGNARNASLPSNNTSGVRGVCWNKNKKRWDAYTVRDGCSVHLGSSKDFTTVVKIRKEFEKKNEYHENHGQVPVKRYWSNKKGSYTEYRNKND